MSNNLYSYTYIKFVLKILPMLCLSCQLSFLLCKIIIAVFSTSLQRNMIYINFFIHYSLFIRHLSHLNILDL